MQRLTFVPKGSLAALVCPVAPFLLPLRTVAFFARRLREDAQFGSFRTFASSVKSRRRRASIKNPRLQESVTEGLTERQSQIDNLAARLQDRTLSVQGVLQAYPIVQQSASAPLTLRLCQWLHAAYRYRTSQTKTRQDAGRQELAFHNQEREAIVAFSDQVVADLKSGVLSYPPWALLHLISFYKEAELYDRGQKLWSWAAEQDDENLSPPVYGAAIELLALSGDQSLQELEDLFKEGLRRWPGVFAEYHFSSNAVLPDRSKLTQIPSLPMSLLQAIMVARAIHGDWRNALLAFDTALRLYPTTTPHMFFTSLIHERPLTEAYLIAHMACRSRISLPPSTITHVLKNVVDVQVDFEHKRKILHSELDDSVHLFESVLEMITAYDAAGGSISAEHVSVAVQCLSRLAINLQYARDSESTAKQKYVSWNTALFKLASQLVQETLDARGVRSLSAYNGLIVLAGKTTNNALAGQIISRMVQEGFQPTEVTFKSLVNASGKCGDLETLRLSWISLVENANTHGRTGPSFLDWITLAVAARDSRQVAASAFIEAEMSKSKIEDELRLKVRALYARQMYKETLDASLETLGLDGCIAKLTSVVQKFEQYLASSPRGTHDFYHQSFRAELFPGYTQFDADERQLRTVYNELTSDPDQHPTGNTDVNGDVDSNGFPIAEHRFRHWCSLNELLAMAESHARYKEKAVEKALAAGTPLREMRMKDPRLWLAQRQYSTEENSERTAVMPSLESSKNDIGKLGQRIRSLRGII